MDVDPRRVVGKCYVSARRNSRPQKLKHANQNLVQRILLSFIHCLCQSTPFPDGRVGKYLRRVTDSDFAQLPVASQNCGAPSMKVLVSN